MLLHFCTVTILPHLHTQTQTHQILVVEETLFSTFKSIISCKYSNTLTILDHKIVLGSCWRNIILVENSYRRKALTRPNITLRSPRSSLFQGTLNCLFVIHLETRIGGRNQSIVVVICRQGRFQSCVGIERIARVSLYTLSPFIKAHAQI